MLNLYPQEVQRLLDLRPEVTCVEAPLLLLPFSGLYLFALPYVSMRRSKVEKRHNAGPVT